MTWCNNAQLNNQRATSRTVLLSESATEEQLLEQSLLEGDDDVSSQSKVIEPCLSITRKKKQITTFAKKY